jgi:hypothetical protein
MTTLALSGGFGNVLFQLNFFYRYKSFFANVSPEGLHVRSIRKARRLNAPSQINYLTSLDISYLCAHSKQSISDYLFLGLSNKIDLPLLGRYWNNFLDPGSLSFPVRLFKTYAQYQVPIQEEFTALIVNRLLEPRSHLRPLASKYDALAHVRCGDLSRTADISDYYQKATGIYSSILVVTDDPIQATHLFPSINASDIISSDSYLDDFALLSFANNIISSNSTFAWWAAELSNASSVIEPSNYRLGKQFNPISRRLRYKL